MHTRREFLCRLGSAAFLAGCGSRSCGSRDSVASSQELHQVLAERAMAIGSKTAPALVVLHPKGSKGNLLPVASAFKAATGLTVDLVETSLDDISSDMMLRSNLAGDQETYDVALPPSFGVPDLAESGTIAPLDALASEYEPQGFSGTSVYTLGDRYKGNLYGYQADGDTYVMFYLRDCLEDPDEQKRYADQFGRELRVPLTWRELDRQLAYFHRPDEGRYGGSLFRSRNYIAWEYWARLHSQGIFPVADDMTPRFNSDEGLAALEQLAAATRYLEPAALQDGLFENFKAFGTGNKYCNIGWGGTQKALMAPESKVRGRIVHGPVPGAQFGEREIPMPYFNWGWNYVVSSRSRRKELAYLFVLFASTPWMSTLSVREASGYFDPHRAEHYDDPQVRDLYGEGFLDVHRNSLSSCIPDFYLRGQGRYLGALKEAVHRVAHGQLDAKQALHRLTDRWQFLTDQLGREGQQQQWLYLKRSYPAQLQKVLG